MPPSSTDRPRGDAAHIDELNARIDRLPAFPLPTAARVVLALLYFFAFYDITVIGVTLPTIAAHFDLTTSQLGYPVTANLAGYVVGAYVLSTVADYVGRRRALVMTLSVLTVGALLTAFLWNVVSLAVFRLVVGVGTGALISLGATYAVEVMPARMRGRLSQVNMFWAGLGLALAPWIGIPLVGVGDLGWRILLALGALAALPIVLIGTLPESPRWLASAGRGQDAEKVVQEMEARVLARTGETALPPLPRLEASEVTESGFPTRLLLRKPYASRLLVVLIFWIMWYLSTYAALGYESTFLAKMGVSEPNSLLFTAIGDAAFPIGALLVYLIIEPVRAADGHCEHRGGDSRVARAVRHREQCRHDHRCRSALLTAAGAGNCRRLYVHGGDLPDPRPGLGNVDRRRARAPRRRARPDGGARRPGRVGWSWRLLAARRLRLHRLRRHHRRCAPRDHRPVAGAGGHRRARHNRLGITRSHIGRVIGWCPSRNTEELT